MIHIARTEMFTLQVSEDMLGPIRDVATVQERPLSIKQQKESGRLINEVSIGMEPAVDADAVVLWTAVDQRLKQTRMPNAR